MGDLDAADFVADRLDRALLGAHVGLWPGQQILAGGAQLSGNAHQRLLHPFKLAVSDPSGARLPSTPGHSRRPSSDAWH